MGLNTAGVPVLKETLETAGYDDDITFAIYEYTLAFDVDKYFDSIDTGIVDGIFTDDSDTARVIQDTLDYINDSGISFNCPDTTSSCNCQNQTDASDTLPKRKS